MPELFTYQKVGAVWLSKLRFALLADEMGVGKTPQAIAAADLVGARTIVVVCPAIAVGNWIAELERWSRIDRGPIERVKTGRDKPSADVVVSSFDLAKGALLTKLRKRRWDVLIVDEAHYCKTLSAERTKSIVGGKATGEGGLMSSAVHTWMLSGTPAPNHFGEMFVYCRAAGVWKKGKWPFMERFTVGYDTEYGYKVQRSRRAEELAALVEPFMLRRRKVDVLQDLPPITWRTKVVPASKVEYQVFFVPETFQDKGAQFEKDIKQQTADLEAVFQSMQDDFDIGRAMIAARESMSRLRRWTGALKAEGVGKTVVEMLEGSTDKVVVFFVHRATKLILEESLKSYGAVTLWGETPALKRDKFIRRFQNNPRCRVLLGQIQACGTAINLTAAHHVVFAELSWVPADNAQAAMRVHRIGQENPVTITTCALENSVDHLVVDTLRRKSRDLALLFD